MLYFALCSFVSIEKTLIYAYLESVDIKYGVANHAHLKYFGITDGLCLALKKKYKSSVFKYVYDFASEPLLFK